MENTNPVINKRQDYRNASSKMGKKEFTLMKMQEYGFWPSHLPSPYEQQKKETPEVYQKRKELQREYNLIAGQIAEVYKEKDAIKKKLEELRKQYDDTWDYEAIRKDVARIIMQESIERRAERKKQRELEKIQKTEAWNKKKSESIVFIGKGYSNLLHLKETDEEKLKSLNLPIIRDDKELAQLLELEYHELRFLAYHRDVLDRDHYCRYSIQKRSGGERQIAAPKPLLKNAQKKILEVILEKIAVSENAHGFIKGKSVVTGARQHVRSPWMLINMDLKNFFPTLTFERVRGMFHSLGYSGYLSSLLGMLCTYCERMPLEVRGQVKYVRISDRILPQGSPASPMITNIICRKLDERLQKAAETYGFLYSRYADDLSFSFEYETEKETVRKAVFDVSCVIKDEGFSINQKKTHYLRKNNRQCITGVVINNQELGVPKVWIKRMRAALHNAEKLKSEGNLPEGVKHEIKGMVSWLKNINPDRYQKMIESAGKLLN